MAPDDLNAPLGQHKRKKLPKLPVAAPQLLAGLLGLFGLLVVSWAVFVNDPLGGEPVAEWARSSIAEAFLKSDFTHLFWIDADISWTPDDFIRILGFGAVLDVVGAAYPFKKLPIGFLINLAGEPGKVEVNGLGCVRIESMGIGFSLFKREVVEKVAEAKPLMRDDLNGQEYRDIFRVDRTPERGPRGEDIAFFNDARDAGYTAWLDPSIKLTHIGSHGFRGDPIEALGLSAFTKEIKT